MGYLPSEYGQWRDATYYDPGANDLQSGDELFNNILDTSPMFQLALQAIDPFANTEYYRSTRLIDNSTYSNALVLPYTSRDNYSCYTEEIGSRVEMISGRVVWETRGRIVKIHYAYDSMPPNLWKKLSSILRSSMSFYAYYRPDDDPVNMFTGEFICESLTPPKFAYAEPDFYEATTYTYGQPQSEYLPLPRWHGIDFTLREVQPSSGNRSRTRSSGGINK